MSTLRETAKMALEALESIHCPVNPKARQRIPMALDALRAALEQQEQEPCKRHNPCERLPDGYCARCHSEMYP